MRILLIIYEEREKRRWALMIYKRHNCKVIATKTCSEMSLPKMPTPIRCELADNLPRNNCL